MNNFVFGVQAIARGMSNAIHYVTQFPLFWGFALGFVTSTLVHGFLISDHPKQLPTLLFHNKMRGFQKLHTQSVNGSYLASYSEFSVMATKVKFVFGLAFTLCAGIILLVLLRF